MRLIVSVAALCVCASVSLPLLAEAPHTTRVIVFLREPVQAGPDVSAPSRRNMIHDLQQSVLDRVGEGNADVYARWTLVPGFAAEVTDAVLVQLRHDPDVLAVDPDVDGIAGLTQSVPLVNGHTVRNQGYTGSGVSIAILDSGVNKTHTDLSGSVTAEACFCTTSGGSGCCPNGSTSQTGNGAANDDNGHGTHVAGIAASRGNSSSYGVAPAASIVSVKVLQASGAFASITQVISGLDWVLNNHPEVRAVNMSLGTNALFTGTCDNATSWTMSLASVIGGLNANGTAVFVSSMNNGSSSQMAAPACIQNAIAVGAVYDANFGTYAGCNESTAADKITCFSNTSTALDLLAPGSSIIASNYTGGTTAKSGTSMASPHAAGAAAVLFGANPNLTAAQVEAALENTGPLIFDSRISLSFPRVDVLAALNSIISNQCTYAISPTSANVSSSAGTGSITVTGTPTNCTGSWSAQSLETWLTLTGTASGNGSGTWQVPYSYTANPSTTSSRTAIVDFNGSFPADDTYSLTQQPASGGLPNLTPYQPAGWSDKVVVSRFTGTTTDAALKVGNPPFVDWAVINNGAVTAPAGFYIDLLVDGELVAWWWANSTLDPGWYFYWFDHQEATLPAGAHTVTLIADSLDMIDESNESDNVYTKTIYVLNSLKVLGDFNGNGTADIGVFRPSTGMWYSNSFQPTLWGANGDIPVAADYNGDGKADIAIFRPSTGIWYSNAFQPTLWGANGDIPVPADYNGDGKADIAIFRPSTGMWYSNAFSPTLWGANGDIPVPADYNGDGKDDIAIFRPSTGIWYSNSFQPTSWGASGDVPVPADYNGDGKADIAVWRPSTGMWYSNAFQPTQWGANGDKAVAADYNGDGKADIAVFRPSTGIWYSNAFSPTQWGANGDFPLTLPVALRHY